jgi:surface antigen
VFHKRKRPDVGDVAFFDNTWDRNKNGRRDDDLTHIAVVEKVERDGTITMIHLGNSGITRLVMNLKHSSHKLSAQGKPWNSVLRRGKSGKRLTGELFSGFGSLWSIPDRRMALR